MNIFKKIKSAIKEWHRENYTRNVPNDYLKGYRRLACRASDINEKKCWTCRNAVAYISWTCDVAYTTGCKYEECYTMEEITCADFRYNSRLGVSRWLVFPKRDNGDK